MTHSSVCEFTVNCSLTFHWHFTGNLECFGVVSWHAVYLHLVNFLLGEDKADKEIKIKVGLYKVKRGHFWGHSQTTLKWPWDDSTFLELLTYHWDQARDSIRHRLSQWVKMNGPKVWVDVGSPLDVPRPNWTFPGQTGRVKKAKGGTQK